MLIEARLFTALWLLAVGAIPSFAEDIPQTLTWENCVRLTSLHNPDLLSAGKAIQASKAQYRGSYNGILPQVNLSNSYSDGQGELKSWELNGTASMNLINPTAWASIQLASANLQLSQANRDVTSTNALLSLYQAFAATLYAQEEIDVNKNIRDTWKTNAQMIALRYNSGTESKGNNMNTQAQYFQAEADVVQAGRDLLVARQQLSQAMGLDDFTTFIVTGTWIPSIAPMAAPDLNQYLAAEPRLRVQEATVAQTRANVKSAESTIWPTLSVDYSKGTIGGAEFPTSPFWTFTGTLSYPLFAGGITSTYYAYQSAERTYEKSLLDLRSLRAQVRSDLATAWSGFASATDQARIQSAFLEAERQRKEESDIRYQSGLMTFDDWILVVNDYVNFEKSYLRSEEALILAEAQWRSAIGQQLGETRQ